MIREIEALVAQIADLRTKFQDFEDQSTLDRWERELQELAAAVQIQENVIIKKMIERAKADIENIDTDLQTKYSDQLSDKSRDALLQRRHSLLWFINDFVNIEDRVRVIKEDIFTQFAHYRDNYSQG